MYSMVIIDDEKWVVRSLVSTIRSQPWFRLEGEAYDGLSGLRLLEEKRPQLAFVDVQMPGMSGLELLQSADELELPTLFIMISGHAEFAYVQKAMFHNAICYCLKPFSKNELLDGMEKAFRRLQTLAAGPIPAEEAAAQAAPDQPAAAGGDDGVPVTANHMVNEMLRHVHDNFDRDISMQDLASLCHINQSYAGQLFRQEVGDTFNNYLTRIRIERAAALLAETAMSIAAVAVAVGYHDYFYFAKVFKRVSGQTPSAYRSNPLPMETAVPAGGVAL